MQHEELTSKEREQIADILSRRSNEIAGFNSNYQNGEKHFGSVELALTREIKRLRHLADRVNPPKADDEGDG